VAFKPSGRSNTTSDAMLQPFASKHLTFGLLKPDDINKESAAMADAVLKLIELESALKKSRPECSDDTNSLFVSAVDKYF
jgi:hypothetical protein